MSVRKFFLASLALAAIAAGLHVASLRLVGRSVQIRALGVGLPEQKQAAVTAEAHGYASHGRTIAAFGLAFALTSAGFVAMSAYRHEPAWRPATIVLLVFYLMLQLIIV